MNHEILHTALDAWLDTPLGLVSFVVAFLIPMLLSGLLTVHTEKQYGRPLIALLEQYGLIVGTPNHKPACVSIFCDVWIGQRRETKN
jgi:hypothetical protein